MQYLDATALLRARVQLLRLAGRPKGFAGPCRAPRPLGHRRRSRNAQPPPAHAALRANRGADCPSRNGVRPPAARRVDRPTRSRRKCSAHAIRAAERLGTKRPPRGGRGRLNPQDIDVAADFLVMLESWEAAKEFLVGRDRLNPQDIDVARLSSDAPARSVLSSRATWLCIRRPTVGTKTIAIAVARRAEARCARQNSRPTRQRNPSAIEENRCWDQTLVTSPVFRHTNAPSSPILMGTACPAVSESPGARRGAWARNIRRSRGSLARIRLASDRGAGRRAWGR